MAGNLISCRVRDRALELTVVDFKPSETLPELDELKAFLASDFGRQLPGFAVLETDAKWGETVLAIVGKDATGGLIAVFPSVSRQERDYHDVITEAMLASGWLEENHDEASRRYAGASVDRPLKMLLVAPSVVTPSRALIRALERAGVALMPYAVFDIEMSGGVLRAVSFKGGSAPAAAPAAAAPVAASTAAPTPVATALPVADVPPPTPVVVPVPEAPPPPPPPPPQESRKPSAVESFISTLPDPNIRAMSEQIMTFLVSRFPNAEGTVNGDKGFTLSVGKEHLATIRLDRTSLWLEVGPEKIPTNKIKDPATLERAMNLPSVLEALHSVHAS